MVYLSRLYLFNFLKDCLPKILFGPFLNTLLHLLVVWLVLVCWIFRSSHRRCSVRKGIARNLAIVCKLLRFKDKQNILRKEKLLKGTNIFINEDYCEETVEYRKELWEEVKVLRSQGKIAYLNYKSIVSRDKVPALSTETEISEY